ncbi:MAG TPA: amidohydrolase family protein [Microbacteriaceae bacterium]|nr:amidohydrolase family protein [Microbacteriaceae bacterium]
MIAPTIDAHLHLWRKRPGRYRWLEKADPALQRDVTATDAQAALATCGVRQAILVQAEDTIADTEEMLAAAGRAPWVVGIVGWVRLDSAEADGQLENWARHRLIRGIRHLVHDDPRDDFLDLPQVRRSLRRVASRGFVFEVPDAWPRHLGAVGRLAAALPDLTVVVDHLAKPPLGEEAYGAWRAALYDVARRDNTVAKVSGLYDTPGPLSGGALRRVWDDALDMFGPDRLLWGGDWPMSIPHGGYRPTWEALRPLVAELSVGEQEALLGGTARQLYRLDDDPPGTGLGTAGT